MNFFKQVFDAMKFTLRDWKAIVLLGIILCIASTSEEFYTENLLTAFIITIISFVLLFIEEGYRYIIIEETLKGNNNPPTIGNFSKLITEGFLEIIILFIYILVLDFIDKFSKSILPAIDDTGLYQVLFTILAGIIYFTFFGAAIYKAKKRRKILCSVQYSRNPETILQNRDYAKHLFNYAGINKSKLSLFLRF